MEKPVRRGGRLRRVRHAEAKNESPRRGSGRLTYWVKVREKQSLTRGQQAWQLIDHLLSLKRRLVTNVWITSPWTKLITNFLRFPRKDAVGVGCSLSLSSLRFLRFAHA